MSPSARLSSPLHSALPAPRHLSSLPSSPLSLPIPTGHVLIPPPPARRLAPPSFPPSSGFLPPAHVVSKIHPVSCASPVFPCICHLAATPVLSVLTPHSSSDPLTRLQLYLIPVTYMSTALLASSPSCAFRGMMSMKTYKSVNHRAVHTKVLRSCVTLSYIHSILCLFHSLRF